MLTSQLKEKNSPVRQFLTKFEDVEGRKECLAQLQSTKPIRLPSFKPKESNLYAFIGTTADYLIRYTANGNSLIFENTIAHHALPKKMSNSFLHQTLKDLYEIGKQYLDGRDASDSKAIYSASALTVIDNFFRDRMGRLPTLFEGMNYNYREEQIKNLGFRELIDRLNDKQLWRNPDTKSRVWLDKEQIANLGLEIPQSDKTRFLFDANQVEKLWHNKIKDRPTSFLLDKYYQHILGGDLYTQDVSMLVKTFVDAIKSLESELFNAQITVYNQGLENSWLVGGADFDCIISYNNRLILTDIKTTTKPLTTIDFRQILGYALLHDEDKDNFKFTDIGIYHSRSGSFRFMSLESIVEKCLPNFKSINLARKAFISEINKF